MRYTPVVFDGITTGFKGIAKDVRYTPMGFKVRKDAMVSKAQEIGIPHTSIWHTFAGFKGTPLILRVYP